MFICRELIKAFCLIEAVLGEDIKTFRLSNFADLSDYHLGLGTWIRNNLLLSESDLYLFFIKSGVKSKDKMSAYLIKSFYLYANYKKQISIA